MLPELLKIYDESQSNPGIPTCTFRETLIFNEGWLLRAVLQQWKTRVDSAPFAFLPFPDNVKVYSEAQLYTPFRKRGQRGKHDGNVHIDGIVGNLDLAGATQSGIKLNPDGKYLAVFEAKAGSSFSKGTSNAPDFDQLPRIAASMINSVLEAGCSADISPYLTVLYGQGSRGIEPAQYTMEYIETKIAKRVQNYLGSACPGEDPIFFHEWRQVLARIQIQFLTWEEVVAEIDDPKLDQFYALCKRFSRTWRNGG